MERLLIYINQIYKIGGIETFIKNFVKRMYNYFDITVLYVDADKDQLKKIGQYVKTEKYKGHIIETDFCIFASANYDSTIENNIIAKKYFQMIHADYEKARQISGFIYKKHPKVTEHISVSKTSCDTFKKLYKFPCKIIYNLLDKDNEIEFDIKNRHQFDGILKLITVSRIGKEKGFDRIVIMANMLKKSGIPFTWDIYGDIQETSYKNEVINKLKHINEVVFRGPTLDVIKHIYESDYLVQLSDTEAFCYSICEALQVGTPCIVTNFPSAYEQIVDGESGYILDMSLNNLDVKKIYNNIPNNISFKELSSDQDWINVLKYSQHEKVKVKVKKIYTDLKLGRDCYPGEPDRWETLPRALQLVGRGWCDIVL